MRADVGGLARDKTLLVDQTPTVANYSLPEPEEKLRLYVARIQRSYRSPLLISYPND